MIFPSFSQPGTLDGTVIRIGGRGEVVPVFLDAGTKLYPTCKAYRSTAKRLAMHLFGSEVRVNGTGRWHVDEIGTWVLDTFMITDFNVLDGAPLSEVVDGLRAIPGSGWDTIPDPWAELMNIRRGSDETHSPTMTPSMDWPLVKITWIDSCEPYVGWQRIVGLEPPSSVECVSVGFLVADGERTKTIAPHITHPTDEDTQGCGIMVIPSASVLSVEKLTVTKSQLAPLFKAKRLGRIATS